jgi:hypothetical protein
MHFLFVHLATLQYLVSPPSLPADWHGAAQSEEVDQLGQGEKAEPGAQADETAKGR